MDVNEQLAKEVLSMKVIRDTVEALLESHNLAPEHSATPTDNAMNIANAWSDASQPQPPAASANESDRAVERDLVGRLVNDPSNSPVEYGKALDRPEPMDHLLTEDGTPMLNPGKRPKTIYLSRRTNDISSAELLTQVR